MLAYFHEEDLELLPAPINHTITQASKKGAVTSIDQGMNIATTPQTKPVAIKPFTAISWVLFLMSLNAIGWFKLQR
jgi:hypothetical protein